MVVSSCKKDDTDVNPDSGKLPPLPDKEDVCSAMDDDVFKNYCYDNFDTNKDGKISEQEYNAVKTINCNRLLILSFKGIEYFANLETFSCEKNIEIKEIDLSHNNRITTISDSAFRDCISLTSVKIPDSVVTIGKSAFNSCDGLTGITIPDSVTTIDDFAFYYCRMLTAINIPGGVTKIGRSAFLGCFALTSITIPDSVMSMDNDAFRYCKGLTAFYGKYASADNRSLVVDGTLVAFARAGLTEYTIPENITVIDKEVFSFCDGLTGITIPEGVTMLDVGAFSNCTGLTDVTIPDSVTTIDNNAFGGCEGLTSITIGSGVTTIRGFAFVSCPNLTSVYCKATTPPALGERVFQYYNGSEYKNNACPIYVPRASVDAYKSAASWSDYSSQIVAYDFRK